MIKLRVFVASVLAGVVGPCAVTLTVSRLDAAPPEEKSISSQKPSPEELKKKLTPEQFEVVCNAATEPPFQNAYWDNHQPGIYVDVVSGEPLFSSLDKFDSGTGWHSFTKPLEPSSIAEKSDRKLGILIGVASSRKSRVAAFASSSSMATGSSTAACAIRLKC